MGINVLKLKEDLDRFEGAIVDEIVEAKRIVAGKALELLAAKSPVLTGTYIYNHTVDGSGLTPMPVVKFPQMPGNEKATARMAKKVALGQEMIMREKLKLQAMKLPNGQLRIDNRVPHANHVEFGISRQYAPSGVYRIVINHLELTSDSILDVMPKRVI